MSTWLPGMLVFDFDLPAESEFGMIFPHHSNKLLTNDQRAEIKQQLEDEIDSKDPNRERFNWSNLLNIPGDTKSRLDQPAAVDYVAGKLETTQNLKNKDYAVELHGTDTYCYSGNKRTCYHVYRVKDKDGNYWTKSATVKKYNEPPGNTFIVTVEIKMVLTYSATVWE